MRHKLYFIMWMYNIHIYSKAPVLIKVNNFKTDFFRKIIIVDNDLTEKIISILFIS